MNGNALANASFLDGATGWYAYGGPTLAADEAALGAPGRIALLASGAVTSGTAAGVAADQIDAAPGDVWEIQAGTFGVDTVDIQWVNSSGAAISRAYATKAQPARTAPRRGLRPGFDWWFGRFTAPAGTVGCSLAIGTVPSSSGSTTMGLIKPFLGIAQNRPWPTTWDPGSHENPDLQLPVWPPTLRPFQNSSSPAPVANAKGFSTDSGVPIREDLYTGLHYEMKGQVRVTPDELEDLEAFYEAQRGQFFVVDPFPDRLCVAEWLADGAPSFQDDQGETAIYQFGLHMMVA